MMITTISLVLGAAAAIPAAIAGVIYTRSSKATQGFFDPTAGGGSWLDDAGDGAGEPLNVSGFHLGNCRSAIPYSCDLPTTR